MKKNIIVFWGLMVGVLIIVCISYYFYNGWGDDRTESVEVIIDKTNLRYTYREQFSGNEWCLYINNKLVCVFEPFGTYSIGETKIHLKNKELIRNIYNNKTDVAVYALPLEDYKKKYVIIYTLNNKEYYCWNDDIEFEDDSEIQHRLGRLYEYVDANIIEGVSEESWEDKYPINDK